MKTRIFRLTAASTIAVAGLALCHCAHASTFRVGGSGNSFTVSRSGDGTNFAETVSYRTVGLSAYGGQHFVAKYGTLTFAPNQTSTNVVVTETMPTTAAYKFQTGASRYYRFEITDAGGFFVTNATRTLTAGTRVTASDAFGVKNLTIQSAEYTADDDGYDVNGYKSVSSNGYFAAAAPRTYFQHVDAQLRMTLSMDAKENDDAYEYLQLLFDNTTSCDNRKNCNDGDPGNINLSSYMAGFEMNSGDKDDTYRTYTFPVTNVANNAGAANPWGHGTKYPLSMQKFNAATGSRATDGRIVVPMDFSSIVLRLNASGKSGSDEWAAKSVVAHVQAVDTNAPTKIAASAAPGIHARGNAIYVSVAFSEPVTGTPSLTTSWGTLNYFSGSGSNVLTFKGTIPADATGALNITGWSGNIKDLAGNPLGATALTQKNLATIDASHAYAIAYDLAGGALPEGASNPATYTYETPSFTLATPTRPGYIFAGWTGSNGTIPQTSVTVAAQSHGDLAYTANWKLNIPYIDADGTERICADYTVLTNATGNVTYGANGTEVWYVVTTNVNISGQLLFNGTAHLILCDGAILAVTNENGYAISSYSFAIYGQTNGTGTVTAIGGDSGIYAQYGAVTINGGTITATGNYGIYAYGGFVTINGGTITAAGASKGIYAYNRSVTINGGTVTATGNHGISGDSVTINGGTVTANATATSGTGIYAFYDVTINGGTITAEGASTGIYADNKSVTINGGTVTATATSNGYGIYANKGSVTINGGTVTANGRQYGIYANNFITLGWTNPTDSITASSYRGRSVSVKDDQRLTDGSNIYGGGSFDPSDIAGKTLGPAYSITLPEGVVASGVVRQDGTTAYALPDTAVTLSPAPGYAIGDVTVNGNALETGTYSFTASADAVTIDATVTPITYTVHFDAGGGEGSMPNQSFTYDTPQALSSNVFARMGYTFVGWHGVDGAIYPDCATVSNLTNAQDAVVSLVAKWGIPYIDADGVEQICADYTVLTNATGDVEYGESGTENWYVVTNNVTISGQLDFNDVTAHLILCDGATLAVTNENDNAIDACHLTIYGQTNGTGAVTATSDVVGIDANSVTINGGIVTATGDYGIYAGDVTINGGTVTANGSRGISAGDVTINGGTVTAEGASTGISANSVTINGGSVTAEGTNNVGIYANDGNITLGWTNPTDSITASSYKARDGVVYVKSDQTLTDGSNIYESGNALNPSDLTGKTLRPAYSITLPAGVVASGVVTQDGTTAYALPGTNVTLSAATPGYAIGNVTVNGNAIDPVGGIYTFAADAASITVTATVGIPVPYIDEDGVERQCFSYTVLTNAAGDVSYGGGSGWYVVTNAVNISGQLDFNDVTAYLILCDGATLAVTNANGNAIEANDLAIYCQTNGTGTVTATGTGGSGIFVGGYSVTINGGTVTAEGYYYGIFANAGPVTINGGTVTANGSYGIYANNSNIILGWTNPTDSIYASSYSRYVNVKDDQLLTDGSNIYGGDFFAPSDLAGKTLRPAYLITLPEGVVASGVVRQDGNTAYALPDANVTLSAAPGYAICNVTVNGNAIDPVDGIYTFTASADGITVVADVVTPSEPDPGNVWHVPSSKETCGRPMRDPLEPGDGAAPFLRLGNQSDVQDGWMTAANIKYRIGTSGAWSSIPMSLEEVAGGEGSQNAYWTNALPAAIEGQTVQYYFEAQFGNSASLWTTYVFDDGADGCDKGVEEVEAQASPFEFTVSASQSFTDPQGVKIEDAGLVGWLVANNFTQSDINALGEDAAATDKLYECWVLNCDLTAANPGGALSITGFAVSDGQISITVQLVRQSPLGFINGALYLYCADDLATGFGRSPIANEIIDFGDGDSTFDVDSATVQTSGSVTQTVTATFDTYLVSAKFIRAAIDKAEEPEEVE